MVPITPPQPSAVESAVASLALPLPELVPVVELPDPLEAAATEEPDPLDALAAAA